MQTQTPFYKLFLKEELARRCEANPNYSMRSFARALGTDPAVLSRVLTNKRALSYKVAMRMSEGLSLSPKERKIFLESVAEDQKQRGMIRSDILEETARTPNEIDAEIFRVIGDWYHYAIQQFSFVEGFQSDPRWIANRLGISVLEAKLALDRLIAVGLMEKVDGNYVGLHSNIEIKDKSLTTPAQRRYLKQILNLAMHSLENDPLSERSMSTMTMPIDRDKIPLAKKLIMEFTNNLCDVLSSGKKTALYQLSVNLFPLEKRDP